MNLTLSDVISIVSMLLFAGNAWIMISIKLAIQQVKNEMTEKLSHMHVEIYRDFIRKEEK